MRSVFTLLLLSAGAFAQNGTIAGTVSDPIGAPLGQATVQAKNVQTGTVYKATSSAAGRYSIADLPPGAYDISANVPGLTGFQRKNVAVEAAKAAALDIRLTETTQLSTLGEDRLAIAADTKKHTPPSGPPPRLANGKPDLSGVWWSPDTVDPGKPVFQQWAENTAKQRNDAGRIDSPQTHCLPSAVLRLGPVYQIVQSPQFMVLISDDDSPGFHQIYTDGRPHPKDPNPAWYGHNIGRWEGDTLVVDRMGFDDRVWLDRGGHPHTDKLHVIERYRRPDAGHLETEITVEDPGVLEKPWTYRNVSDLAPTEEIYEFICPENNKDLTHLVR